MFWTEVLLCSLSQDNKSWPGLPLNALSGMRTFQSEYSDYCYWGDLDWTVALHKRSWSQAAFKNEFIRSFSQSPTPFAKRRVGNALRF